MNEDKNRAATDDIGAALSGIRVLDLTQVESGPVATQMLANLGADVIKLERADRGDDSRRGGVLRDGASDTSDIPEIFVGMNNTKRCIAMDLKKPEVLETFKRFIANVDVFIENMMPGAMERMGITWEVLHEINPRLVYARIKGQHPKSRLANQPAYDPVGQAVSGAMSFLRYPGGKPIRAGANLTDSGAALHVAVAIMAALVERDETGEGQYIQISMQQATMNLMRSAYAEPEKDAGRDHDAVPSGAYPCKGGEMNDWCYIDAGDQRVWPLLAAAIGRPELVDEPRFATEESREEHRAELDEIIAAWTMGLPKADVQDQLLAQGVPAGAVLDAGEVVHQEREKHSGLVEPVVRIEGKPLVDVWGLSFEMSGSRPRFARPGHHGEHNDEVCMELLGEMAPMK